MNLEYDYEITKMKFEELGTQEGGEEGNGVREKRSVCER